MSLLLLERRKRVKLIPNIQNVLYRNSRIIDTDGETTNCNATRYKTPLFETDTKSLQYICFGFIIRQ